MIKNRAQRKYYEKHWELVQQRRRLYRYGISAEEFETLFIKQEGKCAICKKPFTSTPHVDHNHETGKVRGLLDNFCNQVLVVGLEHPLRADAEKYLEEMA